MEVKFKRASLSLNIAFWAGIFVAAHLAKWIYEPNVSSWDIVLAIVRCWGVSNQ